MGDGPEQPPTLTQTLAAAREEYTRGGLDESDLAADPFTMFERWYADALAAGIHEPNAMVVATVGPAAADGLGAPSARLVLLKGFSEEGFRFYTNTGSRKAVDLAGNPRCALLFPWHPIERQVRVDGIAAPLPGEAVEEYFASRPRGSQLGAWASHQSQVVRDRAELEVAYADAAARFDGRDIPPPEEWGGYVVRPEVVEFWQGRRDRLHDRLAYRRTGSGWAVQRLAP